ncbi:MAG: lipoyl(octanoyl) transferase LipB [Desulfopila sp.]
MAIRITDLGSMEYAQAHALQLRCVENMLQKEDDCDQVLMVEHPPVYTLGRCGRIDGILRSREEICAAGIDIIQTERGGDITYHGPGQLVVYPIINLRRRSLSVTVFVAMLEEIMLQSAGVWGVRAARDERNRGIWVGDNKIGSIGIRIRHGISFHGLALNVSLSLEPFTWIQPCGLTGVGVSSLEQECGTTVPMTTVKQDMRKRIYAFLGDEEQPDAA